jgi:hypothetical protein
MDITLQITQSIIHLLFIFMLLGITLYIKTSSYWIEFMACSLYIYGMGGGQK